MYEFAARSEEARKELVGKLKTTASALSVAALAAAAGIQRTGSIERATMVRTKSGHSVQLSEREQEDYKAILDKRESYLKLERLNPGALCYAKLPEKEDDDADLRVKMKSNILWQWHTMRFTPRVMLKLSAAEELQAVVPYTQIQRLSVEDWWDSKYVHIHFVEYLSTDEWVIYIPDERGALGSPLGVQMHSPRGEAAVEERLDES